METNTIRILVASNASTLTYPNNIAQHFKNQFSQPIKLEGKWEMGLTNIQYPATWYNVTEDSIFSIQAFISTAEDMKQSEENRMGEGNKMKIEMLFPKGYYKSIQDICQKMMAVIKKVFDQYIILSFPDAKALAAIESHLIKYVVRRPYEEDPSREELINFSFKSNTKIVKLIGKYSAMRLQIIKGLEVWKRLGFDFKENVVMPIPWTGLDATSQALVSTRFPKVNICCDAVCESYIGTKRKNLLRSMIVPDTDKAFIALKFAPPEFVTMIKGYISTLEFRIEDEDGNLVPFQSGKVIASLKLRRVN